MSGAVRFGRIFASSLKRRRPRPRDKWHLDEVFICIRGKLHYLWRAIDQKDHVLDILVQERWNANAGKRFFKRRLANLWYRPKRFVTDGLSSYEVAHRVILPEVRHRAGPFLNNRAENLRRPTHRREREMQWLKPPRQAQRFLSVHATIYGHFRPRRHLMDATRYHQTLAKAFQIWQQETCVQTAT